MYRKIITLISFKIENKFEEWLNIFDSKDADLRHSEFDINPLFRVIYINYPKKLFAFIRLQKEIFKSYFKKIFNGLKFTKLFSQSWKNHP